MAVKSTIVALTLMGDAIDNNIDELPEEDAQILKKGLKKLLDNAGIKSEQTVYEQHFAKSDKRKSTMDDKEDKMNSKEIKAYIESTGMKIAKGADKEEAVAEHQAAVKKLLKKDVEVLEKMAKKAKIEVKIHHRLKDEDKIKAIYANAIANGPSDDDDEDEKPAKKKAKAEKPAKTSKKSKKASDDDEDEDEDEDEKPKKKKKAVKEEKKPAKAAKKTKKKASDDDDDDEDDEPKKKPGRKKKVVDDDDDDDEAPKKKKKK